MPLAVAQALTATAKHVAAVEARVMPKYLDRPRPGTVKAFRVKIAKAADFSRGNLHSAVIVKDRPFSREYLKWTIFGGTKTRGGKPLYVPGRNIKLDKHGNFPSPRTYINKMLARDDTFVATRRGVEGLWQQRKDGVVLLAMYSQSATYKSIFPYFDIAKRLIPKTFEKQVKRSMARAMRARSK